MNIQDNTKKAILIHALTLAAAWGDIEEVLAEAREAGLEDIITKERCIELAMRMGDEQLAEMLSAKVWPADDLVESQLNGLPYLFAQMDTLALFNQKEMTRAVRGVSAKATSVGLNYAPRLEVNGSELILALNLSSEFEGGFIASPSISAFVLGAKASVSASISDDSDYVVRVQIPMSVQNRHVQKWELGISMIDQAELSQLVLLFSREMDDITQATTELTENTGKQVFEMTALAAADGQRNTPVTFRPDSPSPTGWNLSLHPVMGSNACYIEFQASNDAIERFVGRKVMAYIGGIEPVDLGIVDDEGYAAQRLEQFPSLSGKFSIEIGE